jgi:hypothetical protein
MMKTLVNDYRYFFEGQEWVPVIEEIVFSFYRENRCSTILIVACNNLRMKLRPFPLHSDH